MDLIPIAALLTDGAEPGAAELRAKLAHADIVIGVDKATQREFTVYGLPSLEESYIVGRPMAMSLVRVELDQRAGQLDQLVALVRKVKGRGDDAGSI